MKSLTLLLTAALALAGPGAWAAGDNTPPPALAVHVVTPGSSKLASSMDAQVEAVRDATVSAQVQGAVINLFARVGDRVAAGQELARIDARAAQQTAAASAAQVDAARAAEAVAAKEYERQAQLFQKQYISQAALDRAQAQWSASRAQVRALQAQAGVAATQSGFHVIRAPFSGVVGSLTATVGDMAAPGKPLLTVYDPAAMRITASVGQRQAAALRNAGTQLQVEIPGLTPSQFAVPGSSVQVLPTFDAQSHTVQVRVGLPAGLAGAAVPGMFARLWLDAGGDAASAQGVPPGPLLVPASAVVRRAELVGVYVLDGQNRALLRQIRLGRPAGNMVEVLSGVRAGDRIALEPQAAARGR